MKARNLSHRLIAIITFSIGLGVTALWSGLKQSDKPLENNSDVIGFFSPARYAGFAEEGVRDEGTSDYLMVMTPSPQSFLTEPLKLHSADEDLIEYNCGTIIISVDGNRHVSLNDEETGTLANFSATSTKLKNIFDERRRMGVYSRAMESRRDLSDQERIYKTVLINAAPSLTFDEVEKIIEMVKGTGAKPIAVYTYYPWQ